MATKRCFKCGATKPVESFYAHPRMSDGRLGKCKDCTRRDVRENRNRRVEYYRERDRQRRGETARRELSATYQRSPKGQVSQTLRHAVASGRVEKPNACQVCFQRHDHLHGHHPDYTQPLRVIWVCPACHGYLHRLPVGTATFRLMTA